jgi:hypothetical protein
MTHYHDPYAPTSKIDDEGNVTHISPGGVNTSGPVKATASKGEIVKPIAPTGTTKEILSWVNTDVDRAKAVLETEKAGESPRKGLVAELEALIKGK